MSLYSNGINYCEQKCNDVIEMQRSTDCFVFSVVINVAVSMVSVLFVCVASVSSFTVPCNNLIVCRVTKTFIQAQTINKKPKSSQLLYKVKTRTNMISYLHHIHNI